jgi:hypothetical protein
MSLPSFITYHSSGIVVKKHYVGKQNAEQGFPLPF